MYRRRGGRQPRPRMPPARRSDLCVVRRQLSWAPGFLPGLSLPPIATRARDRYVEYVGCMDVSPPWLRVIMSLCTRTRRLVQGFPLVFLSKGCLLSFFFCVCRRVFMDACYRRRPNPTCTSMPMLKSPSPWRFCDMKQCLFHPVSLRSGRERE